MGKFNPHHPVTSWVAIVIIAAIGSTWVYFIWASANDSWGEEIYPQYRKTVAKVVAKIETAGWKTYRDEGYGFQVRHPVRYASTVSTIVGNSVLGTDGSPVPGTTVGPLVFIKADTSEMRKIANDKFNVYWNYASHQESPSNYCTQQTIQNISLNIRVAACTVGTKKTNYALVKGKNFDVFVDGGTSGFDKRLTDAYGSAGATVSESELIQILSTFEFVTPKA